MGDPLQPVLKFLAILKGRDQANKLVQYAAKAAAWACLQRDLKDASSRLKGLSSGVSTARKLYRFGKTLDFVRKLQQLKFKGDFPSTVALFNYYFLGTYFVFDSMIFLNRSKVLRVDSKWLTVTSSKFWFVGEALQLVMDVQRLAALSADISATKRDLAEASSAVDGLKGENTEALHSVADMEDKLAKLQRVRYHQMLSSTKTTLNCLNAFNASKWILKFRKTQLNDGIIGMCGMIGALCSCTIVLQQSQQR